MIFPVVMYGCESWIIKKSKYQRTVAFELLESLGQQDQVSDAIQPSHPLSSSSPMPSTFPNIRVFSSESVLRIQWPKYWSFSLSISPSNEFLGLISPPCSPRDSQESFPTPQFKSISSLVPRLLYGPTLTYIHDYWKNHTFD